MIKSRRAVSVAGIAAILLMSLGAGTAYARRIGAYYFGVWNENSCNVCNRRNTDPWAGVRQYVVGDVAPSLPWSTEVFDHLQPMLGFYDNSRPEVLERQILQARASGLSFFNFYWYWRPSLSDGAGGEKFADGLDAFLQARNTLDLDFAISLVAHPFDDLSIPARHAPKAVDLLISKYLSQPHYLRTDDGRPIVFLLDTRAIKGGSHSDVVDFLALLDFKVRAAMGVEPFVVINVELQRQHGIAGHANRLDINELTAVDGHGCLNFFHLALPARGGSVGLLERYNTALVPELESWGDKPTIPCYMLDFNEKPRVEVGTATSDVRYLQDWSPDLDFAGLQAVRQLMDQRNDFPVDDIAMIYAWNEWREEGHVLEPNAKDGHQTLHMVSNAFDLDTFGTNPCRNRGRCPESFELPVGSLDRADCRIVAGWSRDADTSMATHVAVFRGADPDPVAVVPADIVRPDLPFRDRAHGYRLLTPAAFKTGREETLHAYGIDIGIEGNLREDGMVELEGSPTTIRCAGTRSIQWQPTVGSVSSPEPPQTTPPSQPPLP